MSGILPPPALPGSGSRVKEGSFLFSAWRLQAPRLLGNLSIKPFRALSRVQSMGSREMRNSQDESPLAMQAVSPTG